MSYLGDTVQTEAIFYNTAGVLADPTTRTATAKKPNGQVQAATVVQQSTGKWSFLFADVDVVGMWFFRIVGGGNGVDAVTEGSFRVRGSSV